MILGREEPSADRGCGREVVVDDIGTGACLVGDVRGNVALADPFGCVDRSVLGDQRCQTRRRWLGHANQKGACAADRIS